MSNRTLLLALWLAGSAAPAQDALVRCRTLVVAPDTVLSPGEFLVRDGRVAYVGSEIPADSRARAAHLDYGDATIVPGLVLCHSTLGQDPDLAERAVALTPELLAAEAFDPFGKELLELPRHGVTSCALAPSSRNVAGGIAALVKPGKVAGAVAAEQTYLKLSLAVPARNPERPPTSLMGAVDLLRQAFAAARSGVRGGPDMAVLGQALRGQRRVFVHADTVAELTAALELAREFAFEPVLLGAGEATECLDRIAAARAAVVLAPLQPEQRKEQLELPAALAQRGVPFGFAGQPAQLRAAAALAVRHGLARPAALAALTRTPAALLGQPDRIGALRAGCDADFAVYGGDPLDLGSALRAVHVGGVLLSGSAPRTSAGAPAGPAAVTTAAAAGKEKP